MAEPGAGHEYCSWDGPNEPPVCNSHHYEEGLIYLAHQAGAEVYPSIGGWSLSDPFPVMAANEDYRANFVRQCVALIKNYNFVSAFSQKLLEMAKLLISNTSYRTALTSIGVSDIAPLLLDNYNPYPNVRVLHLY
jgi:hypothetical protein